MTASLNRQILSIGEYKTLVDERLDSWGRINFNRRLWEKDPTLWFQEQVPEITDRLGWLTLPETARNQADELRAFAEELKGEVTYVVLLGMGGSSLAPKVFQSVFGNAPGYPELIVVDSTHPEYVRAVERRINLTDSFFLVSSKSGTTLETISFFRHFWDRVSHADSGPGSHFAAITDPGSPLDTLARERGFRRVFHAPPDLGGRYSAFTVFGLVPAALIGMNIHQLLDQAHLMYTNCAPPTPEGKSPGLVLGAVLGELAKAGRDKVTLITTPTVGCFPEWLEQLIAESTGKDGKGIIPIVNEPLVSPETYGADRLFVYLFAEEEDTELEEHLRGVEAAGHPTVRINLAEKYALGQEIFRWEVAIAAAGALLGVHPFNQPDVEVSKKLARRVMERGETLDRSEENRETVPVDNSAGLTQALENWLSQAREGDYVSIHAYLPPDPDVTRTLQGIRLELLKRTRLATIKGYGPSFLHSIGQLYKGGPNTGVFLQIVDEPEEDLKVPETSYTFGLVIRSQALGDYQALRQRGRRVLRVSVKKSAIKGLEKLQNAIKSLD
ncbi:MAG: hypothetical protein Q6352_006155 [Candidatus Freyrarchaeum guaymaensis]